MLFAAPQIVFDEHHGTVHEKAEIHRSQAHEVGRYSEKLHPHRGGEHGKGYGEGHEHCGADVAEYEQKDRYDEGRAHGEVFPHGFYGGVDEVAPGIQYLRFHVRRERRFLERALGVPGHLAAVRSQKHEYRAEHGLVSPMGGRAEPLYVILAHVCDIA